MKVINLIKAWLCDKIKREKGLIMVVLYHGTSSRFVKDIVEHGLGFSSGNGKYDEIRTILSKYINPDILTDDFFDKYSKFIDSGSYSKIIIRNIQLKNGNGPFGVKYNNSRFSGELKYHAAPEYAKATTSWGTGEFEYGIIKFLNSIEKNLDSNISPEYRDFLKILKNNVNPKYITNDEHLNFYTDGNYETDFPVLIKFNVPDEEIKGNYDDDLRTKNAVKPEDIEGIAFLPPFYYDDFLCFDRYVPDLEFLPKDVFLKELKKREGKRHWLEPFEIKDNESGDIEFMFFFPTEKLACVQEFLSGEIYKSYFFARDKHINKGKIAEKKYSKGEPFECEFFDKNRDLIARVMYQEGQPFEVFGKRLTPEQLFVATYEKQPQKMSEKQRIAHINKTKKILRATSDLKKRKVNPVINKDEYEY